MKIRTRLLSIIITLATIVTINIIISIVTEQRINRSMQEGEVSDGLRKRIFGLDSLTYDYVLYRSERAKKQWWMVYDEIGRSLSPASFCNKEERAILKDIINSQVKRGEIFTELISNYEKQEAPGEKGSQFKELEARLISMLLLESQAQMSDVYRLHESTRQESRFVRGISFIIIISLLLFLLLVVLLNSFFIARSLVGPITKLHQGTEIIGRGNLDYKVGIYAKDEIGQLSRAFDRMAMDLKEARDRFVRSEKLAALGKLAGIVGHELRNPLGAIRNSVYFLRLKLDPALQDEKIKRHLEMMDQEINNSDRIISDILFFSRVKPPIFTQNNLNKILKASLKKVMINPNIKVETELAELPFIPSDENQLVQVFTNIILNAAESMPKGGKLTISSSVKQDRDFINVSIKDTGEGISKENLLKLFEPLFSTKINGTGLGMVVCKSIIENHKGYIRVESEEGKGTLVTVELPIKQA